MKKNQLYCIVVLVLALQFPVLFAHSQDATLTIKSAGTSISIKCSGYIYTMKTSLNIGSQSSGAGAGKAGIGDVIIQKAIDNNTPTLQQMLSKGENLSTVTLEIPKIDPTGRPTSQQSSQPITITMSNVTISQITHYGGTSVPGKVSGSIEEVTFVAQKIDFGTSETTTSTTTVPAANKIKTGYDIKENKKN